MPPILCILDSERADDGPFFHRPVPRPGDGGLTRAVNSRAASPDGDWEPDHQGQGGSVMDRGEVRPAVQYRETTSNVADELGPYPVARNEVIRRVLPLAEKMARRRAARKGPEMVEELTDIAYTAVVLAVTNLTGPKDSLEAHVVECIGNAFKGDDTERRDNLVRPHREPGKPPKAIPETATPWVEFTEAGRPDGVFDVFDRPRKGCPNATHAGPAVDSEGRGSVGPVDGPGPERSDIDKFP